MSADTVTDRLLGFLGFRSPTITEPAASATPTSEGVLTGLTVVALREMLDEHSRGQFLRSGLLAEYVLRDADLSGALTQRLERLLGLEQEIEPADDSDEAKAQADELEALWSSIASRPAQREMLAYSVLLGFSLAQVVWQWDESRGELVPRLLPWPPSLCEFNEYERQWYVHTSTGPLAITPGDGQWVLYAPRAVNKPWLWGAILCVGEWYLRAQYSAGDASKHSEVHGVPVWLAKLPSGARSTPDGKAFLSSIRNMGRNAVVPLPQGMDPSTSYDLELAQAATDAFRIFEFLLRTAGGKFRLAILGQDLTSQNNLVGTNASSEQGNTVLDSIVAAEAATWSECLYRQVLQQWAAYRSKPELAPRLCIDAEDEEDFGAVASALLTAGQALAAWQAEGFEVDLVAFAERFGMPGKPGKKPAPAAPIDPNTEPKTAS
jgi:phage gp29-like protein